MQEYPQCYWPADSQPNKIAMLHDPDPWTTLDHQLCSWWGRGESSPWRAEHRGSLSCFQYRLLSVYWSPKCFLKPLVWSGLVRKTDCTACLCWELLYLETLGGKCIGGLQSFPAQHRWGWMFSPFHLHGLGFLWTFCFREGLKCGICLSCTENKHVKGANIMYCCYVFPSFRAFLAITGSCLSFWLQALSGLPLPRMSFSSVTPTTVEEI